MTTTTNTDENENPFKAGDRVRDNFGQTKTVLSTRGNMVFTWSKTCSGTLGNTYHFTKLHLVRG